MRWLSRIGAADMLTLGNGFLGILAITYVLDGRHVVATLLIYGAVVLDGLDGIVARHYGSPHDFGRYLDSISDAVSFCLAPGLIIYHNFYDKDLGSAWTSLPNALAVIVTMAFAGSGLLRLARFAGRDFSKGRFVGLPAPAAAMLAGVLCLLWGREALNPFALGYAPYPVMAAIIGLGLLMLSDVPYPKMRGRIAGAAAGAIALGGFPLAVYLLDPGIDIPLAYINLVFLGMLAAYVALGPMMANRRGETRKSRNE